jgi:peptide/nickel transport system substrate-binding protein
VARANRSRALIRLPALLAAACLVAGCNPARVPKDELVVLIEAPPNTLDPHYAISSYDFKMSRLVYAALVSADTPTLELEMVLAESIVPQGGNDWLVTLRDAQFSDGRPVTADDVAYNFERIRDPKSGGAAARLRKSLAEAGLGQVEVLDAKRLVLHGSKPDATLVADLNFGIVARPPRGQPEPANPIGAGPFVLRERRGEEYLFDRNQHYFAGAPKEKKLVVKTIRDDNSRLLALVGGSGDLTQNTISPLLLDAVAAQPRLKVETGRSSVYSYLGVNCDDPILKDVRVRRAIAYAIDREELVHAKLRDRGLLATGMLPTFHWAYRGDVPTYEHDKERAKKLLDEAGYPDPDGNGPKPRFTLVYRTSNNRFRVAIAQVIARMLGEVGIEVDLRVNEFATFFADVKKGNFQLFSMQIPEIAEPDLYTQFYSSKRIPTRDNLDAGGNRQRYSNPQLDQLLDEGRGTLDREERKKIYGQIQFILARDLPAIPLWHEDNVAAMRKEVNGYVVVPTAQLTSLPKVSK